MEFLPVYRGLSGKSLPHRLSEGLMHGLILYHFFFKSETPLNLVLGGIRTHNLLIFGQTSKPPSLGLRQEPYMTPYILTGTRSYKTTLNSNSWSISQCVWCQRQNINIHVMMADPGCWLLCYHWDACTWTFMIIT